MKKINLADVPEVVQRSPKGAFALTRKHISLALGGVKDAGPAGGGHPFDLELATLPPSCANWPMHAHSAQWELYIILSGSGETRTPSETVPFRAGDVFLHPPGEAHQLRNTGTADLVYYVIADQPAVEVNHYPDSNKWIVKPAGKCFRMTETGYYDGEES